LKRGKERDAAAHESGVVRAFVVRPKQERYLELLGKPRNRAAALHALGSGEDLDSRFMTLVARNEQTIAGIAQHLQRRGADARCYVMSEMREVDGQVLPLEEALQVVVGSTLGTIVSCVAGRLAYFESEIVGERWLLERGASGTSEPAPGVYGRNGPKAT
jgi:hypothetical protein